jgi:hypothetical protein
MSRVFLALILVSSLWAQTPGNVFEKAPPGVDDALRDRIGKFYQAHVDKKFRQADQYVAEDSKDTFFAANKPACLAFRIDKVVYSENFTKAKATVFCKQRIMAPGFPATPMDVPMPDTWKLENGQWFWYLDLSAGRDTPFGHTKPAPEGTPDAVPDPKAALAAAPSIETIWKSVQADKQVVQLSTTKLSTDQVTISNKMPGVITLSLEGTVSPGVRVKLDRTEVKAGEQAIVAFRFQPGEQAPPKPGEVGVRVQPTNQLIPIGIEFQ